MSGGVLRIAFVHEWLVTYAGSEKVLAEMLGLFPEADLFCILDASNGRFSEKYRGKKFSTSFLQIFARLENVTWFRGLYRYLLPLMPIAMEQIDLSKYDLVVSNSHAVAKGVITGPDQIHISYCYTPMRYAWDLQHQYLREQRINGLRGMIARWMLHRIRMWDVRTSNGVDHFFACSSYIERRIWKAYRRRASVIYPGADLDFYKLKLGSRSDYYVTASRMVPYKKVSLIAEAFASMPDRKLVIIGDGPQFKDVQRHAAPNILILGYQPDDVLLHHLQNAKAYVFAAEEDFGISPVEAQACGTPVLAFGKGGACETVVDGVTGLLFAEQSVAAIHDCVDSFERGQGQFDPIAIRHHAENFSIERFRREFKDAVDGLTEGLRAKRASRSKGALVS